MTEQDYVQYANKHFMGQTGSNYAIARLSDIDGRIVVRVENSTQQGYYSWRGDRLRWQVSDKI